MLCDLSADQNAVQRQRKLKASRPRGHLLFNNDVVSTASKEAPFGPQRRRIPPLQNQVVVQYGHQCVHQNPRLSDATGNTTTPLAAVPLPPIKRGVLSSSLPQRVNRRSLGSFWTLRVNGIRHVWTAQTSREPVATMRKRPKLPESGGGPRDACQRVWWEQVFVTGVVVAIVDTTRGFTRELVRVRVRLVTRVTKVTRVTRVVRCKSYRILLTPARVHHVSIQVGVMLLSDCLRRRHWGGVVRC